MQQTIPDGYRVDARGRLIPEAQIKPIDLARDQLVRDIVNGASKLATELQAFKRGAFDDIEALVELSADQYGVKLGGKKGNVQLVSFDGRYKVLRAVADRITFDERLQAAKVLIDECLNDWTDKGPGELRVIVQDAFDVDKAGNINVGKILSLRRHKIDDERWKRAMDAIGDAIQVIGTTPYIRVYERIGDSDKYRLLSLDLAGA
ncbi:MAG: sulfate transporter [Lysobacteraceae bacterium SCN 69-48]|nr:MAG: sulfate transporter [Xanthomonadaceae bacterium SCN 69-48]